MDPTIRAQLNKVEVVADPEIEALFPELQRVIVKVIATDGREFEKQIDYPKGDPRNPLTDQEIEEKFDALAAPILDADARGRIKDTVWNLEQLGSITDLMKLMKV
jgi:2-methylcitrate dehydratase